LQSGEKLLDHLKVLRLLILFFIVLLLHVSSLTAHGRHAEPYCGNGQSLRYIGTRRGPEVYWGFD
jgi:hypothetical protein